MFELKKTALAAAVAVCALVGGFQPSGISEAEAGCNRKCHSKRNLTGASKYCIAQKSKGKECIVKRANLFGCGNGWSKAGKWGGRGKDYIACTRSKRHVASVGNLEEANAYCSKKKKAGVECKVKRSSITGCGKDWSKAQTFGGKGKNYIACTRSSRYKASQENKQEAEDYCKSAKAKGRECIVKKSNVLGCGKDWTKVEKFNGKGKNYIACERSSRYLASKKNKAEAEEYCERARKKGQQCKVIRTNVLGCGGKKWRRGRRFDGKGKNYLTCIRNNVWEIDLRFVIAGTSERDKREDVEAWLKKEIREAERLYSSAPALVINEKFIYRKSRGGKDLDRLVFSKNGWFHKYMDDHFDVVATSKTSGYMNVLVTDYLKVDGKEVGGKANFPNSVHPFNRKHGPALVIPKTLPMSKKGSSPRKRCARNFRSTFAHELGHIFGLKHTFEPYVLGGTCNKNYEKGKKAKGKTLKSNGTINLMDHKRWQKDGCYRKVYLNSCQEKRAARKRKQWMTRKGEVKYKSVRGRR